MGTVEVEPDNPDVFYAQDMHPRLKEGQIDLYEASSLSVVSDANTAV